MGKAKAFVRAVARILSSNFDRGDVVYVLGLVLLCRGLREYGDHVAYIASGIALMLQASFLPLLFQLAAMLTTQDKRRRE